MLTFACNKVLYSAAFYSAPLALQPPQRTAPRDKKKALVTPRVLARELRNQKTGKSGESWVTYLSHLHHYEILLQDIIHISPDANRAHVGAQILCQGIGDPQVDLCSTLCLPASITIDLRLPLMSTLTCCLELMSTGKLHSREKAPLSGLMIRLMVRQGLPTTVLERHTQEKKGQQSSCTEA